MKKIMKARKGGFTLVELLIVIIIIAILAGMMLLTTGAATDGAEASKLVSNLRSLKSAALMHFIDNGQTWLVAGTSAEDIRDELSQYMDRSIDIVKHIPDIASSDTRLYIGFSGGTVWTEKPGIVKKLSGMARDAGLYKDTDLSVYDGGNTVYMNLN